MSKPPRIATWLVRRIGRDAEYVLAELLILYSSRVERLGKAPANRWYWSQSILLVFAASYEKVRIDMDTFRMSLETLLTDVGHGVRRLVRRPGYLIGAALTLGLGAGGLTTVYTVANWVLLRPVPGISEPDRLALLRVESNDNNFSSGQAWAFAHPDLLLLREMIPSLGSIAAGTPEDVHIFDRSYGALRTRAMVVTANFFDVIGLEPQIGRTFSPADHAGSAPREIVISDDLWNQIWDRSEDALGTEVTINEHSYSIIGVTPPGFRGAELPGETALWFAHSALATLRPEDNQDPLLIQGKQLWSQTIGRMRPGVSIDQVATDANIAMNRIRDESNRWHSFAPTHFEFRAYQEPGLSPWVRVKVRKTLGILGAAGGLLLALALANVGNLGLARLSARKPELAIRRALGSSAWRVSREPLIESALIGVAGGLVGVAIAYMGIKVFGDATISDRGATLEGIHLQFPVVAVAVGFAIVSALLAGLPPAIAAGSATGSVASHDINKHYSTPRLRAGLVIAQVALSSILIVGAGMLVKSATNINQLDLGFDPDGLASFTVEPRLHDYTGRRQAVLLENLHRQIAESPSVSSVGFIFPRPLRGWRLTAWFAPEGANSDEGQAHGSGFWITPGTLSTMGFRFVGGTDTPRSANAVEADSGFVVINRTAAMDLFPGESPVTAVGRRLVTAHPEQVWTIAGVVEDSRVLNVTGADDGILFTLIHDVSTMGELTAYVRTSNIAAARGLIRSTIREVAPELPAFDIASATQQVESLVVEERVLSRLGATLALTGLFLTAVGLYGVLSYSVTERTREIGIRTALGARPAVVFRSVVGRGLILATIGMLVGVPAVNWIVVLIESVLYEVSTFDPGSYALGIATILLSTVVACATPALRALRISPTEALREN